MVSAQTRSATWNQLLDVSRGARYYDALASRYRRRSMIARIVLGLAATGAVVSLLGALPEAVGFAASGIIGIVAVVDLVLDFGRRSALLDTMATDLSNLEDEYQRLWEDTFAERVDDSEVARRLELLSPRVQSATSRLSIGTDAKLNKKCAEDTYRVEAARYAA